MKFSHFFKMTSVAALLMATSLNTFAAPTVEEFLKQVDNEKNEKGLNEFDLNPLSKYMTREQYDRVIGEATVANRPRISDIAEGKIITINTADQEGCKQAVKMFNLDSSACIYDAEAPMVSVVVMRESDQKYFEKKIDFTHLSKDEKVALKSLKDFSILGAGAFGLIYAMPESVSKWDKSKGFMAIAGQWKDRVAAGPVIDQDDWVINYIGHPLSGAAYYTMVRHRGLSAMQSAAFSFCMSTFFWEYGIEAFAEIPSIQDLILTPLIGSLIGEVYYSWGNAIERNGGKLLGSKILGKTATVLMDPATAMANGLNRLANKTILKSPELFLTNRPPMIPIGNDYDRNFVEEQKGYLGLQLKFKF